MVGSPSGLESETESRVEGTGSSVSDKTSGTLYTRLHLLIC